VNNPSSEGDTLSSWERGQEGWRPGVRGLKSEISTFADCKGYSTYSILAIALRHSTEMFVLDDLNGDDGFDNRAWRAANIHQSVSQVYWLTSNSRNGNDVPNEKFRSMGCRNFFFGDSPETRGGTPQRHGENGNNNRGERDDGIVLALNKVASAPDGPGLPQDSGNGGDAFLLFLISFLFGWGGYALLIRG
jgi:hypothetical protein